MPISASRYSMVVLMVLVAGCASSAPRDGGDRARRPEAPAKRARVVIELEVAADVAPGAKRLRVWIPLPPDEPRQAVVVKGVQADPARRHRTTRDSAGNPWIVLEVDAPTPQRVALVLEVASASQAPDLSPGRTRPISAEDRRDHAQWLVAGTGIPLTDATKDLAASIVALETNPLVQARKLLEWIRRNLGIREGEGPGDAAKALELATGTSADLTCVLVALARASGLPARPCRGLVWDALSVGVKAPIAAREECWLEFYAPNVGWVSVDPAMAIRGGAPKDGAVAPGFGVLDERRIVWARGTDLRLDPAPAAYAPAGVGFAHVEVDGTPVAKPAMQRVIRAVVDTPPVPQPAPAAGKPPASGSKAR